MTASKAAPPREAIANLAGTSLAYCDLSATAARHRRAIAELPFAARLLAENIARNLAVGTPGAVEDADVEAAIHWDRNRNRALPLHPERIILPDSSGLPVLLDLAALRSAIARAGGDPTKVEPIVPVDLIVDHSLQVDYAGSPDAAAKNLAREFERNGERYRFLKWAAQAFSGIRVFPPGTGIIHQVNLEFIAHVVSRRRHGEVEFAVPDFVIGGDSHTPMINGIGVLGWGTGGIDLAAAMLGETYVVPAPEIVGVALIGERRPGTMTTDIALGITERLRRERVVGTIVEYFGASVERLSVPDRATIANMAPEYGATCGLFPVDATTIAYLRQTRSDPRIAALTETYCKANALFRDGASPVPRYDRVIEIDISRTGISVAGPRRPQDRMDLGAVAADFKARLDRPAADGGLAATPNPAGEIRHGAIAVAAVTSCTNTSNPSLMLAAGLVARKAHALGLRVPAHVKTSLTPGSRVVSHYLTAAGLMPDLEALGFHIAGYGCTTCGGKSGPLHPAMADAVSRDGVLAASVLSGNRNFEGRIHKLIRANYIMSPPLVVAYALAGNIDVDLATAAIGSTPDGRPVRLAEIWPSEAEIAAVLPFAHDARAFATVYGATSPDALWTDMAAPTGALFEWDPRSTYLVEPPFFAEGAALPPLGDTLAGARVIGLYGDSLTTDHISPGGEIPPESPSGLYLQEHGVEPRGFNSYIGRRCNHEVMARATFGNLRIRNMLAGDREGWFTRHHPTDEIVSVHEAANRYAGAGTPVIVIAGMDYGTGSSRDWAAKGPMLIGVRAVIAGSFERIHRANLIGMGILPLRFRDGESANSLGLDGTESYTMSGIAAGIDTGSPVAVQALRSDGRAIDFTAIADVHTNAERTQLRSGGILAGMHARARQAAR